LKYAGSDATEAFDPVHPPGVIDAQLPREKHLGMIDGKHIKLKTKAPKTKDELSIELEQRNKPPISKMHSVFDLEVRTICVRRDDSIC
jgi:L-lactate dehydrogenase (cytochrome)